VNLKEDLFLLTVEEVADILRLQPLAVFRKIYQKQIRPIRIGTKTIRFKKAEPYRYINEIESKRFYAKGMKFKNIGNFEKAIACLKDATNIYPLNKSAHFQLGQIYYNNIKEDATWYDLAKKRFEKVLQIDFEDRNTHLYLAKMNFTPQRLNSHNPYNSYPMEGELLTIKELADVLRVQYLKAREMVINDEIRGIYIGRWKIKKTDVCEYIDKQESEMLYRWAMEEKKLNISKAIDYFKEATRIYPLHKNAHLQLAEIYLQKTNSDNIYLTWAYDRFKKALEINPEDLQIQAKIKELERLKS
jgi:excisionase family DNA binding protein